ncbi:COG4705 family protein [Stenotrophomonas acidaminiphila]
MTPSAALRDSKVPEVTFAFWITKILATTLGEVGGDAVTMSMDLGYLLGTVLFAAVFAIAVAAQIRASGFRPWLYWAAIIASTTVGTTLADYVDRSLDIGYGGGSSLLLALLLGTLFCWRRSTGSVSVADIRSRRSELFYWLTITFSQTLGTALGDWAADTQGLGYGGGIVLFGGLLALVAALHFGTRLSRTLLFWAAFVLTRPLGAVVGDFLDKPLDHGGLALDRYAGSLVLLLAIVACVALLPQRAARQAH